MRFVTFYRVQELREFTLRRFGVILRDEVWEGDSLSASNEFVVSRHFTYRRAAIAVGRRNARRREIERAARRALGK